MTVLIIGADRIGAFVPKLERIGVKEVVHWNCRSQKVTSCNIPVRTDLVIFCTDFLHHTAAKTLKKKIKERGIPAVFCRRAWSEIEPAVNQYFETQKAGAEEGICCGQCRHSCRSKRLLN